MKLKVLKKVVAIFGMATVMITATSTTTVTAAGGAGGADEIIQKTHFVESSTNPSLYEDENIQEQRQHILAEDLELANRLRAARGEEDREEFLNDHNPILQLALDTFGILDMI